MTFINWLINVNNVAFFVLGYPMTYIELIATFFGLISVYLAAKGKVATWPTGIINEIALFALFFQIRLYADMLLQIFFLVTTIFGWYNWQKPEKVMPVTRLSNDMIKVYGLSLIFGTILTGFTIQYIHKWIPSWLPHPATYPYADSFVMVGSMLATFLLARKKLETWIVWIVVDVVSIVLYAMKHFNFLALEYVVFLGLATAGLLAWRKKLSYA